MTTATETKPKTPQADVRNVGGKTTVTLRAFGQTTIDRMTDLVTELCENAKTHNEVHSAAVNVATTLADLKKALTPR
jgi:hypothetical protein